MSFNNISEVDAFLLKLESVAQKSNNSYRIFVCPDCGMVGKLKLNGWYECKGNCYKTGSTIINALRNRWS